MLKSAALLVLVTLLSLPICAGASATRGLEDSGLDQYVEALQRGDFNALSLWFKDKAANLKPSGPVSTTFEDQYLVSLNSLAEKAANLSGGNAQTSALRFAKKIFREQMKLRNKIVVGGDLAVERRAFVLLQALLEEGVMFAEPSVDVQFENSKLEPTEALESGLIRNVETLPGDMMVQISATYLSSHFIAQSQTSPGLASHSLVISKTKTRKEVIEALIEDGVNLRAPTSSKLARLWVLSAKTSVDRIKVGQAVEEFIVKENIPLVTSGSHGPASPLLYDSTMNPDRIKDRAYFCTALVQEIYRRAGLNASQNPYLENQGNWNTLTGIEKSVYDQLDITAAKVPAPGDALVQPEMLIRSLVVNAESLRLSRRLRATVDAFYDTITNDIPTRNSLLAAFNQIPKQEVNKRELLAAFDQYLQDPQVQASLGSNLSKAQAFRNEIAQSLPQTANMRQIAFFMILNSVIQDRALAALKAFEEQGLKRHATPGELRIQATAFLGQLVGELSQQLEAIARMSTVIPR